MIGNIAYNQTLIHWSFLGKQKYLIYRHDHKIDLHYHIMSN